MATAGGRQLTLFQCCIPDSHDGDGDGDHGTGTKRVRLSPRTDDQSLHTLLYAPCMPYHTTIPGYATVYARPCVKQGVVLYCSISTATQTNVYLYTL